MDPRRAAAALLALAACFACSTAAPTTNNNNQTALDIYDGPVAVEGCYYNFQHYGEGDRIMTNEPCLNCTCHNRMLMCYLRVCPFTKPIGQDCTVEKRADQCCPIVTCPDVPVDLLTSTSTTSPAEYGATGLGKLDKYGCSIHGKYFPEGSKVPPAPNKPCEHCYCIRNMTTCVMQECTLHVDGCTPIYHKDVCCPMRYSCDHEDEIPLLDDMTTTVRPTPGFLLTTTTIMPVTQASQECVHDDQVFPDGALIKTEKACEHCYCMKGDIVCVVQECGTPMENEGKNCVSLPPRQGQCCPDTYICEGDETSTTGFYEETTTLKPPRRVGVEGSGYRNEPDEPYTGMPLLDTDEEGSGEDQLITTVENSHLLTSSKDIFESTSEYTHLYSNQPDVELSTDRDSGTDDNDQDKTHNIYTTLAPSTLSDISATVDDEATLRPDHTPSIPINDDFITQKQNEITLSFETSSTGENAKTTISELTTKPNVAINTLDNMTPFDEGFILATKLPDRTESTDSKSDEESTTAKLLDTEEPSLDTDLRTTTKDILSNEYTTISTSYVTEKTNDIETTPIDVHENEIAEDLTPGRIPGEGDCLLNGLSYKNNTIVPSSSKCHSSCKCVSSIIKCDPIICALPQEYMNDCYPIYDSPESCCPTYVCNTKETSAPESHSQMSGTESPKPTIECVGDECRLNEEDKPIIPEEKLENNECGENGCPDINLSQKDSDSCNNGKCETNEVQNPIIKNESCDSDKGCKVPATMPCEGDSCKTEFGTPIHKETDLQEKPIDENEDILCKEENCRRKEHSDVDQKLHCSGGDCFDKETIPVTVGLEISTEVSQSNELTTKSDNEDRDMTHHTDDSNLTQGFNTLKPPTDEREQTISIGQTTGAPTTTFEISKETQDYSSEEINTQHSATYEATTENIQQAITEKDIQNKEPIESVSDKVNTSSIEEDEDKDAAVTENFASTVEYTPEKTENAFTEYSTHADIYSSTSKVETDLSESTKQFTSEPNVGMDTTKPGLVPIDTTMLPNDDEISHEQGSISGLPEITESPSLEEQTTIQVTFKDVTTNTPTFIITERDEIVTEKTNSPTEPEEKITVKEEAEIAKDVTEPFERTTLGTVTELVHSTSSDYIISNDKETGAYETTTIYSGKEQHTQETTSDKDSFEIHETTTIYSEVTKHDDIDLANPETSTPKKILEASSTQDYTHESTGDYEKTTNSPLEYTTSTLFQRVNDTDILKDNELLTTALPELNTIQEETKTTPSTYEHPDITITFNDYGTTRIHNDYPTNLSTNSDSYITSTHISTENKQDEQKTTISDQLEQQTEKINTMITTPKEASISLMDEVTHEDTDSNTITTAYVTNNAEIENMQTESIVNKEVTTIKPIESTHSEGPIQTIDGTKTTVVYSDTDSTELIIDTESPVVSDLPKSTTPASYTELIREMTTLETVIVENEEDKRKYITTDEPSITSEADIVTESNEYSEEPEKHVHETENVGSKPADSELPQEPSESTTPTEELNISVSDEMPTTDRHDMHNQDGEIITSTDKTDLPISNDVFTEKPEPTETSDLVTSQIPDLRDRPESTEENIQEIVTDNIIAGITNIPVIEKETETPMSLVTESQSITSEADKITENDIKVTETNKVASNGPHGFTTESSLDTTMMEGSFVSPQSGKENVTPESQLSTGYEYPKPTTESLADGVSTIKVLTMDKEVLSDIPPEKDTQKETTHYYDETPSFTSTTSEKTELADESKPNTPETTQVNEVATETESENVMVEKEVTPTSAYIEDKFTKVAEEITESSTYTGAMEGHEIESSEKTPQYSQYSTANVQDISEKTEPTTDTSLIHSTDITHVEIQTTPTDDTSDVKITSVETTPSSPSIIISTDSSQKETAFEPETMTEVSETIPDSAVTEAINRENEITQTETSVTKIQIPQQSSTETHPETETEHSIDSTDDATQSENNQAVTTESADLGVTKTPDDQVTFAHDEVVSSEDGSNKPTDTEPMTPTTEHVSDTKLVEQESTTEVKSEFSETTPYFVELEEHTHQIVQETTVIPMGEYFTEEITTTKTTQRGDQMFTDLLIEDAQTEKSNEVTSEPSETHASPQFIEEQTSQEKDQTTPFAVSYGTTTITALQPENETDVKVEKQPIDETTTVTIPNIMQNEERLTTIPADTEKPLEFDTKLVGTTKTPDVFEEKPQKQDVPLETTTLEQERLATKSTTHEIIYESTSVPPVKSTIADEKPTETATSKPVSSKAPFSDIQPTEEMPTPDFPPSGYDQEPDYGEEDQAFGPGTCRYGGKVYVSAQQIPRDDPCDFCFCFRSDIICLQQSCPPPIHGCHEEPIQGFCCPRYECPVSMATTVNVTTTTTTTTTTLPPHFLPHAYKGAAQRKGCHIKGHSYKVGEVVRASSGPCLHCTCGGDGQMKCDPKACTPEPMLRQMIAAAVSAKRRR